MGRNKDIYTMGPKEGMTKKRMPRLYKCENHTRYF